MTISWRDEAIFLSSKPYGEKGAIIQVLTKNHGRYAGFIYGGQARSTRAILQSGTLLEIEWQAKLSDQLGFIKINHSKSISSLWLDDPIRLSGISSACGLIDLCLPDRAPHPEVFIGLKVFLETLDHDDWPIIYFYLEKGLLSSLGFGLDLTQCAVTGETAYLTYVSPKTGRAVSEFSGQAYKERLLNLPSFMCQNWAGDPPADQESYKQAYDLMGYFLEKHIFHAQNRAMPIVRERFAEKLKIINSI